MIERSLCALVLVAVLASPSAAAESGACASAGLTGAALLAAVSAAGWAVLRAASKEAGWVKTSGQVVGWTLTVGGLLGFACGALCHAFARRGAGHSCDHAGPAWSRPPTAQGALPPGHPPLRDLPPPKQP